MEFLLRKCERPGLRGTGRWLGLADRRARTNRPARALAGGDCAGGGGMELDGVGHGVGSGCLRSARGSRAARMIRPYSTRRGPARTLAARRRRAVVTVREPAPPAVQARAAGSRPESRKLLI